MRLKNVPGSRDEIKNSDWCIKNPEEYRGLWKKSFFNNDAPLYIEIGTGKGKFIIENALKYPDIDFIGIEMYSSVLVKAVRVLEAMDDTPKNLCLLSFDATNIENIFDENEVDRIYLNFSDPWPKDRHAKRRLTSTRFLNRYLKFLKIGGEIHFKTDNNDLFDFSLEELKNNNWEISYMTRDLHAENKSATMLPDTSENIMTEYEMRFVSQGVKINKLIAVRPHSPH